ncbi:MAG: hypothetical protein HYU39_05605 [Thaumarchaeota archaeon]|nr:hypothetical protein [Nitrososphaerota archaeon]
MSEKPPDVTIKLKRGTWEIEITTSEDRIRQVVESVLAGFSSSAQTTQSLPEEPQPKPTSTCRGLILNMWQEEWFTQERNLADVHNELARRGYHYDRTAVSHSLTDLVRENVLTRVGEARNYRYVQKKPPNEKQP